MNYIQFNEQGRILCVGSAPDGSDVSVLGSVLISSEPFEIDIQNHYVMDGEVLARPSQPPHHEWDWTSKQWLPDMESSRVACLSRVAAELNARLYAPCNGFDADQISRERISGMIARLQRGDPLPNGWVGWRDASNQQHWAEEDAETVLSNLISLSRDIEDREQSLLVAAWQHKAAIQALVDSNAAVTEIAAYPVDQGWGDPGEPDLEGDV